MAPGGSTSGVAAPPPALLVPSAAPDVSPMRGFFDRVEIGGGRIAVAGWVLDPDRPVERIDVYVDGARVVSGAPVVASPHLLPVFPHVEHADEAGFSVVTHDPAAADGAPFRRVEVVAFDEDGPVGRISIVNAPRRTGPLPPAHLMERVAGSADAYAFDRIGLKCAGDFAEALAQRGLAAPGTRVLDWGCGCGRVTSWLPELLPGIELDGCDIDGEAVGWLASSLPGTFAQVPPVPPTSYADATFDAVLGCSVMTHLDAPLQLAWLEELARVLRPGGLALLSVHGELAARFSAPTLLPQLRSSGFDASIEDGALEGVAERGYYRAAFQSRAYTERAWNGPLSVVDYVEAGVANYHDLVVLCRR